MRWKYTCRKYQDVSIHCNHHCWFILQSAMVHTASSIEINSGLQLTISPTFLSPNLSPVCNPSGGMVPIVAQIHWIVWWYLPSLNCSIKNLYSRRPVAFPESRFQYATTFFHLPLDSLVWFAERNTFDCPCNYWKQYVPSMSCVPWLVQIILKSNLPRFFETQHF